MKFSLVTTCRNEMRSLPRWRKDVERQTRQPEEIVVVDAFSNDGTSEHLQEWSRQDSRVRFIQEKGAPAHGRNVAIEQASHEYILSTDLGVRLAPVWCEELIKPFEADPSVEVVAGGTQIDRETLKTAAARAEYYLEKGGMVKPRPGFVVGNRSVAYLKRVWRELGGLPEDLTFCADDSVFGRQILQAGYKMAFAPNAMTYWARPAKLRQFWKEQFNYGKGDGEAMIKVPIAFRMHQHNLLPRNLVPLITSLRFLQKHFSFRAASLALAKLDLVALFAMPVLLMGNGYNSGKGFLIGDERGQTHCLDCRKRLAVEKRSA